MTKEKKSPAEQGNDGRHPKKERTVEQIMDELYVAKKQLLQWQEEVHFLEIELLSTLCSYERKGKYPRSMVGAVIKYYCDPQKSD